MRLYLAGCPKFVAALFHPKTFSKRNWLYYILRSKRSRFCIFGDFLIVFVGDKGSHKTGVRRPRLSIRVKIDSCSGATATSGTCHCGVAGFHSADADNTDFLFDGGLIQNHQGE